MTYSNGDVNLCSIKRKIIGCMEIISIIYPVQGGEENKHIEEVYFTVLCCLGCRKADIVFLLPGQY